jgi:murein DD-endopeptidase MepM/ murein hydrolase activator NlpD
MAQDSDPRHRLSLSTRVRAVAGKAVACATLGGIAMVGTAVVVGAISSPMMHTGAVTPRPTTINLPLVGQFTLLRGPRAVPSPAVSTPQATSRNRLPVGAARSRPDTFDWVLPLKKYRITGRFGQTGAYWSAFHHGLDFAAPAGTPVHTVGQGHIIAAGWSGSAYGNRIKIRHPDGSVTLYAHLSEIVRWRGSVQAGDLIGRVGATGNATGPHMHLVVRPNGGGLDTAVDPAQWLRRHDLDP